MERKFTKLFLFVYFGTALLPGGFVVCQSAGGPARIELTAGAPESGHPSGATNCAGGCPANTGPDSSSTLSGWDKARFPDPPAGHPHCDDSPIGHPGPHHAVLPDKAPKASPDVFAVAVADPSMARVSPLESPQPFLAKAFRSPRKPASLERSVILRR